MARILLVDDERELCEAVSAALEGEGHAVEVAHDEPAGLRLIETKRPDLVVLDLTLQGGRDQFPESRQSTDVCTLMSLTSIPMPPRRRSGPAS
jgi:DNA-binding response OmpR family regulator